MTDLPDNSWDETAHNESESLTPPECPPGQHQFVTLALCKVCLEALPPIEDPFSASYVFPPSDGETR